jgi:hypothetical protein
VCGLILVGPEHDRARLGDSVRLPSRVLLPYQTIVVIKTQQESFTLIQPLEGGVFKTNQPPKITGQSYASKWIDKQGRS